MTDTLASIALMATSAVMAGIGVWAANGVGWLSMLIALAFAAVAAMMAYCAIFVQYRWSKR